MKYVTGLVVLLMMLAFYGCSTPKVISSSDSGRLPQRQEMTTDQGDKSREGAISEEEMAKAERERLLRERGGRDQQGQGEQKSVLFKDILFEYDSYTIRTEDLGRLKDIGAWLNRNKAAKLTVEGHCDERGTQEYNLVLGQKRSEVVKEHLVKTGVDAKRINAVSYGKEAPADQGHTEEAWALNRRAHFNLEQ